jgi:hypothetical protein
MLEARSYREFRESVLISEEPSIDAIYKEVRTVGDVICTDIEFLNSAFSLYEKGVISYDQFKLVYDLLGLQYHKYLKDTGGNPKFALDFKDPNVVEFIPPEVESPAALEPPRKENSSIFLARTIYKGLGLSSDLAVYLSKAIIYKDKLDSFLELLNDSDKDGLLDFARSIINEDLHVLESD